MNAMMEEISTSVDPREEVKKLQDMVRQLELQNKQLRNRQRSQSPRNVVPTRGEDCSSKQIKEARNLSKSDEGVEKLELALEDLGVIDIDEIEMSDEESWLYMSPKGLTPEEKSESPYKWLKKDLDDPDNRDFHLARISLVSKLDELALLSAQSSNVQNLQHVLSSIKAPGLSHHIDSRTFTRPRRRRNILEVDFGQESSPGILSNNSNGLERKFNFDNVDGSPKVPEMTVVDVHEIARLQEESLRQSSPLSTPKRSSAGSSSTGLRSLDSPRNSLSDTDSCQDVFVNQVYEGDNYQRTTTCTGPSHLEAQSQSPCSSPYGSNSSLPTGTPNSKESTRRSLPNLSRTYNGLRQLKSSRQISDSKLQQPKRGLQPPQYGEGRHMPAPQVHSVEVRREPVELATPSPIATVAHTPGRQMYSNSRRSLTPPTFVNSVNSNVRGSAVASSPHPLQQPQVVAPSSAGSARSALPRFSRIPPPRARTGIPSVVRATPPHPPSISSADEDWSDGCY